MQPKIVAKDNLVIADIVIHFVGINSFAIRLNYIIPYAVIAVQHIVAGTTVNDIVIGTTINQVVVNATADGIVSAIAVDDVVANTAENLIGSANCSITAVITENQVIAVVAVDGVIAITTSIRRFRLNKGKLTRRNRRSFLKLRINKFMTKSILFIRSKWGYSIAIC